MNRSSRLTGALFLGAALVASATWARAGSGESVAIGPPTRRAGATWHPPSKVHGGKLMIVGSGLTDALADTVVDRLISDVGGQERLRVLVVPGASDDPSWLFGWFEQILPARGVPPDHIELAHIAGAGDKSVPAWQTGAYESSEVAKVARANVVWFSGGDQKRLVKLLVDDAGRDSPFETALKAKFAAGDVIIAGHSAGAAVLSDPMIGGGTSLGALTRGPDPSCTSGEALCVEAGLGYVPSTYQVMIDQHFTQRGRLARLVRALAVANRHTGWGVGAETALYVDLKAHRAEVLGVPGSSFVTIIGRDGSAQNHEHAGPPFVGDSYTVSLLGVGDFYQLPDSTHPHGVGVHPVAADYHAPFSGRLPMHTLTDAFGEDVLIDRIAAEFADGTPQAGGARVDAIAFDAHDSGEATGVRLRFTADRDSAVAWNVKSGLSIFNARLAISSISGRFVGLGP